MYTLNDMGLLSHNMNLEMKKDPCRAGLGPKFRPGVTLAARPLMARRDVLRTRKARARRKIWALFLQKTRLFRGFYSFVIGYFGANLILGVFGVVGGSQQFCEILPLIP